MKLFRRVRIPRPDPSWQGVAGVAAVVAGVALLAGVAWALVTVGGFLLLAAAMDER